MKIEAIEVSTLRVDFTPEQRFRYAGGTATGRVSTIVRVHTDTGMTGIGSAYTHPVLARIVVEQHLAPHLVGKDPTEVETLWDLMYRLTRWYGRQGVAHSTLGALDVAFWDLRAQAAGKPLWSLLGAPRAQVPAYASALLWHDDLEQLDAEVVRHLDAGFRRVKMRLGRSREYDESAFMTVRRRMNEVGGDVIVDGSMRYSMTDAKWLGKILSENSAFWFEEPFAPEDLESFNELRLSVSVRLSAGENEFGTMGFREMLRRGTVDIVQPDVSRTGGITEVLRVAELARHAGAKVATHSWSDAIAIMANAHIVAGLPHGISVEIDRTVNPMVSSLLAEPLQVVDGLLMLSEEPGLGITIDEKMLAEISLPDGMDLPNGNYSDMVFGAAFWSDTIPYGMS